MTNLDQQVDDNIGSYGICRAAFRNVACVVNDFYALTALDQRHHARNLGFKQFGQFGVRAQNSACGFEISLVFEE